MKSKLSLKRFFQSGIWLVMLCGCATSVRTVYDPSVDFTKYKTFCWMEGCETKSKRNYEGPSYLNDTLLIANIRKAIVRELNARGLKQDLNNPDLLVGFTIALKDEEMVVYHPQSEDLPEYRPLENRGQKVKFLEGTLVVSMADKNDSKIVWETFADSYLDLEPDFSEKAVLKGIKNVLKKYPPKK